MSDQPLTPMIEARGLSKFYGDFAAARDISFEDAMAHVANEARAKHLERRRTTQPQRYELLYRNPNQPSQDGNTVELGVEQAKFAENAMAFETSTTFLNMKLNGLKKAINGQ